jgi:hypothetical protein
MPSARPIRVDGVSATMEQIDPLEITNPNRARVVAELEHHHWNRP